MRGFALEAVKDDQQEVARVVAGFEHHADNRAPFFVVTPSDCGCAGSAWKSALSIVQDVHGELRSAGAPVGSLPTLSVGEEPVAQLSVVLAGIVSTVEAPAHGLLVCFELGEEIDPEILTQLNTMLRSRELEEVRFVVIAGPSAKLEAWAKKVGEDRMWFYRLEPATQAGATQTLQELDAEERIGPGFRGAWPIGTKPPPRPRRRKDPAKSPEPPVAGAEIAQSTPEAPAEPESTGDPELDAQLEEMEEQADFEHELSILIRRAEAEIKQERTPEGLRLQTQARELCTEHGEHLRAIQMEMMLGGYLLMLDKPQLAAATFARADAAGFEHQAYEQAAKAQLNQGIAYETDGDTVAALKAYRRTIETGKGVADSPMVVFEAYRRAGEVALAQGLDVDCIGLWADAVAYARDLEPERRDDTAKELAKRLSELLTRHRRYSQAREIDRIAEEF